MDLDLKVKMIQLGNAIVDNETKEHFQNHCMIHAKEFDYQAWDMFSNLIEINVDEMKGDRDFWSALWDELKIVDPSDEKFGLRSGMRIALIQEICDSELVLNK